MGFKEQYDLSQSSDFRSKIRVAIAKVATIVQGEAQGAMQIAEWNKRGALATAVLNEPDQWVHPFAIAVVTNAAITGTSTDADLEFQVTAVWSDMAGVLGSEL